MELFLIGYMYRLTMFLKFTIESIHCRLPSKNYRSTICANLDTLNCFFNVCMILIVLNLI